MNPLAIVQMALGAVVTALGIADGLIPDGKLKTVLEAVESAIKDAQGILGDALAQQKESQGGEIKAKLSKLSAVKGDGEGQDLDKGEKGGVQGIPQGEGKDEGEKDVSLPK
jgi:hypothetical protein